MELLLLAALGIALAIGSYTSARWTHAHVCPATEHGLHARIEYARQAGTQAWAAADEGTWIYWLRTRWSLERQVRERIERIAHDLFSDLDSQRDAVRRLDRRAAVRDPDTIAAMRALWGDDTAVCPPPAPMARAQA